MITVKHVHHRILWWLAVLTMAGMLALVALSTPLR